MIITSCTRVKVVESDRQLPRAGFALGVKQVAQWKKELKGLLRTAGEIYSGEHHVRLMRGVEGYRKLDGGERSVAVQILSARYGMIPEDPALRHTRSHLQR
jgi:hypothetical protein